jgi:putative transposase
MVVVALRWPESRVKQVEERIWLVSFMQYDLGFFDHETCRIESAVNPFAAKVSPMSPI